MKIFAALLLCAVALVASPLACPPVLSPDGQTVNPSCPGLGAKVYATPGSTWQVWWNDNNGGGDNDFNDLVALVQFDQAGTSADVSWIGGASAQVLNSMFYQSGFLFSNLLHPSPVMISSTASAEVEFQFGNGVPIYETGGVERNPDDKIHAYVANITTTPEPGTLMLIGGSLLLLCVFSRRRRA